MNEDRITRYFVGLEDISHRFLRKIHQEIAKQDLKVTGNQFMVLKRLDLQGKMTVSGVAEDLGVSLSAVTALVDRLCKAEYATRRRDENDRRLVWLELTEQGKEVVKRCDAVRMEILEKYMSKLDEGDLTRLLEINDKLLQIIKDEEKDINSR